MHDLLTECVNYSQLQYVSRDLDLSATLVLFCTPAAGVGACGRDRRAIALVCVAT